MSLTRALGAADRFPSESTVYTRAFYAAVFYIGVSLRGSAPSFPRFQGICLAEEHQRC
jgi:hypothetical protein